MQAHLTLALLIIMGLVPDGRTSAERQLSPATARLVRQYRIQVYSTFRTDRANYDDRREAWEIVFKAWSDSRASEEPLIAWLRQGIAASQSGTVAPLPPVPNFYSVSTEIPRTIAKAVEQDHRQVNAKEAPRFSQMPADLVHSRVERRNVPIPKLHMHPSEKPQFGELGALQPKMNLPRASRKSPAVTDAGENSSRSPLAKRAVKSAKIGLRRADNSAAAAQRQKFVRHRGPQQAKVNLVELVARIDGYNRALKQLEDEIIARKSWSIDALHNVANEIELLAIRRSELMLYVNLLDARQRNSIGEPLPTRTATKIWIHKFDALRHKYINSEGEVEKRALSAEKLRELSQELKKLETRSK